MYKDGRYCFDLKSILGLVLCAIVVIYGIVFGQHISVLGDFFDVSSILITFGGALCCVLIMSPSIKGFLNILKALHLF